MARMIFGSSPVWLSYFYSEELCHAGSTGHKMDFILVWQRPLGFIPMHVFLLFTDGLGGSDGLIANVLSLGSAVTGSIPGNYSLSQHHPLCRIMTLNKGVGFEMSCADLKDPYSLRFTHSMFFHHFHTRDTTVGYTHLGILLSYWLWQSSQCNT